MKSLKALTLLGLSSLILAGCSSPTSSSESPSSSEEPSSSETSSSSSVTPVVATIKDIVEGQVAVDSALSVSGIVTDILANPTTSSSTLFTIQDGDYAVTVRSYVNRDIIAVNNSLTVVGRLSTFNTTSKPLVQATDNFGSIALSVETYAYNTIVNIQVLEELDNHYACYVELGPIYYVSDTERSHIFNITYNDMSLLAQFYSTISQTELDAFIASIKEGTGFRYQGALTFIRSNSTIIIYSLSHVSLAVSPE